MKVWILSSNRWNSAITEYALRTSQALEGMGHQVLFSPLANSPAEKRAKDLGLTIKPIVGFSIWQLPKILTTGWNWQPQCIITCGGKDQTLIALARFKHIPQFRFRGERIRKFSKWQRLIHNLSHQLTKAFIAPCQIVGADLSKFTTKPIAMITLGLDEKHWAPALEPTARPECVIFGRFDPIKGHREFLPLWKTALEQYISKYPDHKRPLLRMVGRAENLNQQDLEQTIRQLNLNADVLITQNTISQPQKLLSNAALGIVPSLGSEVICRVAQEFLLCGTPVLVSDAGGLREVLFENAGTWFEYTKASSAEKIFQALENFLNEPAADRNIRREKAIQQFSLHQMGLRLDRVLHQT